MNSTFAGKSTIVSAVGTPLVTEALLSVNQHNQSHYQRQHNICMQVNDVSKQCISKLKTPEAGPTEVGPVEAKRAIMTDKEASQPKRTHVIEVFLRLRRWRVFYAVSRSTVWARGGVRVFDTSRSCFFRRFENDSELAHWFLPTCICRQETIKVLEAGALGCMRRKSPMKTRLRPF